MATTQPVANATPYARRISAAAREGDYARVITLARKHLALTQTQLGERLHVSAATISRYETGARPLRDVDTLKAFAAALDLPPALFGLADGAPGSGHPGISATVIEEDGEGGDDDVRRRQLLAALTGTAAAALVGTGTAAAPLDALLTPGAGGPMPLPDLRRALETARAAYDACAYHDVGHALPELLASAQASRDATTGRLRENLAAIVARTYILAADLAIKRAEDALSWVLADRAQTAAGQSGDPATIAAAARAAAIAMRRGGHPDMATNLLTRTADDLDTPTADVPLDVIAPLLCTASYASAQRGDPATATETLGQAYRAATHAHRPSLAAVVGEYAVSVHHALGDSGHALEAARRVNPRALPTRERRVRLIIDTARAWHLHGNPHRAHDALRAVSTTAPEELRRPGVQSLISELLYGPGPTPAGLRDLAIRADVE